MAWWLQKSLHWMSGSKNKGRQHNGHLPSIFKKFIQSVRKSEVKPSLYKCQPHQAFGE